MPKTPTNGKKVGEEFIVEVKEGTEAIPKNIYKELARYFLPQIKEYYDNIKE